jgi:uncharacterized membrane protein
MRKASILSVYLMALLYIAAGVNHFVHPAFYEKMIANFLPDTDLIVKMSGLAEIALGLLLLFPKTRRIGAYGVILLLIAVFPANINMALHPQAMANFATDFTRAVVAPIRFNLLGIPNLQSGKTG